MVGDMDTALKKKSLCGPRLVMVVDVGDSPKEDLCG